MPYSPTMEELPEDSSYSLNTSVYGITAKRHNCRRSCQRILWWNGAVIGRMGFGFMNALYSFHTWWEMEDNHSLTIEGLTKWGGNIPRLIHLPSITICKRSTSMSRCRYTNWRPCHSQYNPDYNSRNQITHHMPVIEILITMANNMSYTMTKIMVINIPNMISYLYGSYITKITCQNQIPNHD